jgi:hypothetical protein
MRVFIAILVSVAATVSYPLAPPRAPAAGPQSTQPSNAIDWAKFVNSTEWVFDKVPSGPLGGNWADIQDFTIRLEIAPNTFGNIKFEILSGDKLSYSWTGHGLTVFKITNKKLFYADYSYGSNGGSIVAVDLTSGKQLWKSRVVGVRSESYSAYSNEIRIDLSEGVILIWGRESAGRYFEVKRLDDGTTVGHRVYKENE